MYRIRITITFQNDRHSRKLGGWYELKLKEARRNTNFTILPREFRIIL